ncbi:hypothetical protein BDW68DRAFT_179310 [Aspergillus falconensis]
MAAHIPRYLAPPEGIAQKDTNGRVNRRVIDSGPYGVFIDYIEESAAPCTDWMKIELVYQRFWAEAEADLTTLLWGSDEARQRAKRSLESLNHRILEQNPFVYDNQGLIEVANWSNAGTQLTKAVRDFHVYGSTARFEDVRDFIWGRIRTMNYPVQWRVKRADFAQQVYNSAARYACRPEDLDTEDGIYQEQFLDNPSGPEPSSYSDRLPKQLQTRHSTNGIRTCMPST